MGASSIALILLVIGPGCFSLPTNNNDPLPSLYSLQSKEDPNRFHVFFPKKTYIYFEKINIAKVVYFLTDENGMDRFQRTPLDEATCIANNSYCYVTGSLPTLEASSGKPAVCNWAVTLRGNLFKSGRVCEFADCPNMETGADCHLSVVTSRCPAVTSKCQYPADLRKFLPNITTVEPPETTRMPVLASFGISILALVSAATIALTAYLMVYWCTAPKLVVLLNLSEVVGADDDMREELILNLPPMPSKKDAKRIIGELNYSLDANSVETVSSRCNAE